MNKHRLPCKVEILPTYIIQGILFMTWSHIAGILVRGVPVDEGIDLRICAYIRWAS